MSRARPARVRSPRSGWWLAALIGGLGACREFPGQCQDDPGLACLRFTSTTPLAVDRLALRLSDGAAQAREETLTAGVAEAFSERRAFALQVDVGDRAAALTVDVRALRGEEVVAQAAGRWERAAGPLLLPLLPPPPVVAPPYITTVDPPSAPTSAGTRISVKGGRFSAGPALALLFRGAVTLPPVTAQLLSPSELSAQLPDAPFGASLLAVRSGDETLSMNVPFRFYYGKVAYDPAQGYEVQEPRVLAAADLLGDGEQDLAAVQADGRVVLHQGVRSAGIYSLARLLGPLACAAPRALVAASLDDKRDGRADLAVLCDGSAQIYYSKGDGQFEAASVTLGAFSRVTALGAADLDQDQHQDLVVGGADVNGGRVQVFYGNGDRGFRAGPLSPAGLQAVAALALTSVEGKPGAPIDVVVAAGDVVTVLRSQGQTLAAPNSVLAGLQGAQSVVAAQLNTDAVPDLVVGNGAGQARVLIGKGQGSFDPGALLTGDGPLQVLTGDLDRDDKDDILVVSLTRGRIALWRGLGDGRFESPANVASYPDALGVVRLRDLDGDGRDDLIGISGPTNQILRNTMPVWMNRSR